MKTRYNLFSLLGLTLALTACESMVQNLNVDPNNPTNASANLILTGTQLANVTVQEGHTARVVGMWAGYFTGSDRQYKDINNYNVTGSSFDQIWENVFYGVVEQTKLVIARSEPINNRLVMGIAKIVQANAVGTATACWGDVPFSEAGDIIQFPNPKFDAQADVYAGLQTLLDGAIKDLESGIGTSPGAADIHFGGASAKWLAAAYTLKARFYQETRQYALAYAATQKGVTSAANALVAPHGSTLNANENLMYAFIARNRVGDLNAVGTAITKLLDPTATATYRGNTKTDETARFNFYFLTRNASGAIPIIPNTSSTTTQKGVFAQTAAFPLVSYEENLLTAAEAGARSAGFVVGLEKLNAFRKYMSTGGYIDPTYRTAALTFKYDPYVTDDFAAGGLLNRDRITPELALLREILQERYVTFFGQKLGFIDLRRTRKEAVGMKLTPNAGTQLPERLIYSEAELFSNTSAPKTVPGIFVATPVNQQ